MTNQFQALLIGDNELAKFHPMNGFDVALKAMLPTFELHATTDYDQFKLSSLLNYPLCIVLADRWVALTTDQAQGIHDYVSSGGSLLMVHQGISLQNTPLLSNLIGGRFTHHPEQTVLTYQPATSNHIIMKDISAFSALEEPYQFSMNSPMNSTILFDYVLNGQRCIGGWAHSYGLGKVVYLSPGHNLETLHNPTYQSIIQASVLWLTKSKIHN